MNNKQKAILATAVGGVAYTILADESGRKVLTKVAEATMNAIPDTITIDTRGMKNSVKTKVESMTGDTINLYEDGVVEGEQVQQPENVTPEAQPE